MTFSRTSREPLPLLAEVGFAALVSDLGGASDYHQDDDDDEANRLAARAADMIRVRDHLLTDKPQPRGPDKSGVRWLGRHITWPDRCPDLVCWAGQMSLQKIISRWVGVIGHRENMTASADLFGFRYAPGMKGGERKKKGEPKEPPESTGVTGLDCTAALDAIDSGFSLDGVPVVQRPGMELLAIVGVETLPLLSWPRRTAHVRECGFVLAGVPYRMPVEHRAGYYYRWGMITPAEPFDFAPTPLGDAP